MVKTIAASAALLLSFVLAAGQAATGQEKSRPEVVEPATAAQDGPAKGKEGASGEQNAPSDQPPHEAYALLTTRCKECHGKGSEVSDFNIFSREAVLKRIDPKNPRGSKLFNMLFTEKMPQTNEKLSLRELRIVEDWITRGAPFPKVDRRKVISELDVATAIEADLSRLRVTAKEDVLHQRYLSLVHLHNNPQITEGELRLYRAAISKLLNSLSRRREIKVPRAIDREQTIFRIDLRNYGWKVADWTEVLKRYPYGLEYRQRAVAATYAIIQEIFTPQAANPIAYVRGDWFVARASLPDLYYLLLGLPDTVAKLETELKVTVDDHLKEGRDVARAGFYQSGVSVNNRLVERHVMSFGAYWKSYDFKGSSREKNLFLRPLGPAKVLGKEFDLLAFQHDGGEIIYNLPNGLQAYFLIDGEGKRIEKGPIEVVRDRLESAGSPVVLNGLSCIACHERGIKRFKDAIREGFTSRVEGAEDKVEKLYPAHDQMEELLKEDELVFQNAVFSATREFLSLKTADDVFNYPEPVSKLAQRYNADLTLDDVERELGMDAAKVELLLARDLPLGSLRQRPIKREFWESKLRGKSVFQEAALRTEVAAGTLVVQ